MSIAINPNKALWEKGDFTRIAASMRESGEALVNRIGIKPGMKVLDLGCGDGTTALPAAKLGADVLGVELYWDRPKERWPRTPAGELAMFTRALDLDGLMREAAADVV